MRTLPVAGGGFVYGSWVSGVTVTYASYPL